MRKVRPLRASLTVKAWFAVHGITSIERIVADNGACYRPKVFVETVLPARQQRIKPYTPWHNGNPL
jgi:peptide methionine sulfoxide reductase MsrA